jgi:hypothetical protein
MSQMNERKKYILISVAALVGLLAITFVPMIFNNNSELEESNVVISETKSEPAAPSVTAINNPGKLVENLPDSRIKLIEGVLSDTVKMNVSSGTDINVSDAVIRDGTYRQTLSNPSKQVYLTAFIVDIPSLKQSYRVEDYYSPLPAEVSGLYDYANPISCLDEKELIYGDFNCTEITE